MTKTAIHVDHIARIEGHGNVHVVIEDGVVKTVEMNVVEPARLFESMVRGRIFHEVPYIASRICGICSASHVVTDLKAIERVFGVQVSDRTRALRELLVYGSYLQNHATHLFVFAAPDFLGQKSVFPLADIDPALFDQALGLKALGNELCTKVGGRSVHPITARGRRLHRRDRRRRVPPPGGAHGRGRRVRGTCRRPFPRLRGARPSRRGATCWPWWRTGTIRWSARTRRGSWTPASSSTRTRWARRWRNTPWGIRPRCSRACAPRARRTSRGRSRA